MSSVRPAVLLLGDYRYTLTFVRSLWRAGYRTVVAHQGGRHGYARYSRFCHAKWVHPPLAGTGEELVEALAAYLGSQPDIGVIIPLGDGETRALALHEYRLPKEVRALTPNSSITWTCLNKIAMCEMAAALEVPQAPYATANTTADLARAADSVGYPCIVKPGNPLRSVLDEKAVICHSREDLPRSLSTWPPNDHAVLVQRFAAGPRYNVQLLASDGTIVARLVTKTIRTDRLNYTGYTTESVTVAATPEMDEYTSRLIEKLRYSGYGCLQFLIDPTDHSMSFLELNPRLGAAFAVAELCGVDFPLLGVEIALGAKPDPQSHLSYPLGKRIVWTGGDLEGILRARRAGHLSWGAAAKWLWRAAIGFVRADTHTTWRWSDPWPTLRRTAMLLAAIVFGALRQQRNAPVPAVSPQATITPTDA
jgi:predicted ATP-grasp superfamily ATP-dependent carboligase